MGIAKTIKKMFTITEEDVEQETPEAKPEAVEQTKYPFDDILSSEDSAKLLELSALLGLTPDDLQGAIAHKANAAAEREAQAEGESNEDAPEAKEKVDESKKPETKPVEPTKTLTESEIQVIINKSVADALSKQLAKGIVKEAVELPKTGQVTLRECGRILEANQQINK